MFAMSGTAFAGSTPCQKVAGKAGFNEYLNQFPQSNPSAKDFKVKSVSHGRNAVVIIVDDPSVSDLPLTITVRIRNFNPNSKTCTVVGTPSIAGE